MNSYERTFNKIKKLETDRLPAHPLFMVYAADLIGAKYSDYVRDYRILVKGQLALVEKFPLDIVSCCSDAWREAADCGAELILFDHQPPLCQKHIISSPNDLINLKMPNPYSGGRMTDRIEAIKQLSSEVKYEIPILGWVEGPVAESVDLYGMNEFMLAIYEEPNFINDIMDWVTEMEIHFALAQVEAGADIIGIGDAAASLVPPKFYIDKVVPRQRKVIQSVHNIGAIARLHICGSLEGKFSAIALTEADIIDIDYPQTIEDVRKEIGMQICLTGNLNPVLQLKNSNPQKIINDFSECHRQAGESYILAPGCEVPPNTPEENICAMFEYAKSVR